MSDLKTENAHSAKKTTRFDIQKTHKTNSCCDSLPEYVSFDNRPIRVLTQNHDTNFVLCIVRKFVLNLTHSCVPNGPLKLC